MDKINYRIGLDIGIASVGWAAILTDDKGEPEHIIDLGVRVFDKAEMPKDGSSLAAVRREARSSRRVIRRRRHRLDRIKILLQDSGLINIEQFMDRYYSPGLPDVYRLRYEGLDRILSTEEFAQILIHYAKHRGFKSNRKAETESKENGQVLEALESNQKLLEKKNYRTVGEMLFLDEKFRIKNSFNEEVVFTPRNKSGNYHHMIRRSMIVQEIQTIFEKQRSLGNLYATKELESKYLELVTAQRSFDMGPGCQADGNPSPYAVDGFRNRVGMCTFEKEEKRAPKASFTAEWFVALQKINHIRIVAINGENRLINEEERRLIQKEVLSKKEVKYSSLRKLLKLKETERFNSLNYSIKSGEDINEIEKTEKAVFVKMPYFYAYKKIFGTKLGVVPTDLEQEQYDRIATILTEYKNDDSRTQRFKELNLESKHIDKLLSLNASKYQHLSIKAMRNIIPYLLEGLSYDKACVKAGYDFRGLEEVSKLHILKGPEITNFLKDITNPIVKRSVSQTIKVLNAIILKYGTPLAVNIELAREMSKTFEERNRINKEGEKRFKENEKIKKEIQELNRKFVTGQDIVKYRLWQEQQHICPYSGKTIPQEKLFEPGFEVDHIIPYSISFDDSYRNKVLVYAQENQNKGNRTPYEYFGHDERRWSEFEARLGICAKDYRKRQRLLKRHYSQDERRDFKARNLNDTKYVTSLVYNMILKYLEIAPVEGKRKQVWAVNGAVTAYLRKRWGFPDKDRSTDRHHALDAVIIACCTDGMIHRISRYMQGRELRFSRGFEFVDEETGEIFNRSNFTKSEWDEMFGVRIPEPWKMFRDELTVRMSEDPRGVLSRDRKLAKKIKYPEWIFNGVENDETNVLKPIFISRMPNHKVTGPAHKETIRSPKQLDCFDREVVVSKVSLDSLKLDENGEIKDYYEEGKKSDRLLYEALVERLKLFDNDAKKAFKEEFRKPKSDGSPGPIVKKVKIQQYASSGVSVNSGKGFASNGQMIRIDVFRNAGKYYVIPIYTSDVIKKNLPNKAVRAHKAEKDWKIMSEEDFLFSLYPNDLIYIESDRDIKAKNNTTGEIKLYKSLFAWILVLPV